MSSSTKKLANPFGGPARYITEGLVDALDTYCAIKGIPRSAIYVIQGSNNVGVKKSAGTHDGNNCIDTSDAIDEALLKKVGVWAEARTRAQGFDPHTHMALMFGAGLAWLASAQERAYRSHRSDGLGNLSHVTTSWCPRYRSVRHVKGPASYKGVKKTALRDTYAYSQAGCDPKNDKDLVKRKLSKGATITAIVGRVECQSKDYYVTQDGEFILVTDLGAHAGDKVTIKPDTNIYVTATATVGYAQPALTSTAKVNVARGAKITGNGQTKTSKTFVRNTQGFWFLRQDLDVRKAPTKPKPVAPAIVGLRVGTLNMPDDSKVPALRGETTRAEAAAKQIEAARLHVVFMQELVGPASAGKPSAWAAKVLKALGSEWGVVVGRTELNENYTFYRKAVFNVRQLDDIIIRVAGVEGKHGTPAVLTHEATGRELFTVCTHLVANNEPGAGKQGSFLGPKVRELAAGRVTIVGGDMNTNGLLSGLANAGLKNTRKAAVKTDNSATYTNQSKSRPSTSVEDIIDQIWVTEQGVTVTRHEVVSATSGGKFIEPRISDHMLTWAELTIA